LSIDVYIIGFGDIGRRVASLWLGRDACVVAMRRRHQGRNDDELNLLAVKIVQLDLDQPETLTQLNLSDAIVYYFAPPPAHGLCDTRVTHFISAVQAQTPKRLIYISTSGVYGDCDGRWVSEDEPLRPSADRSRRRLDAEKQLQAYSQRVAVDLVILRVPGIYGAGRLPIDRIKQRRPVVSDHDAYTNRIHQDDLARICVAAGQMNRPAGVYNISDGAPGSMAQYFIESAAALGLPAPPEISWQQAQQSLSPEMLSYLSESRRIDNKKMLRELGIELLYPDLSAGLKASVGL